MFFNSKKITLRLALTASLVVSPLLPAVKAMASAADDIKNATNQSQLAAKALASQLLNRRLLEAANQLMASYVQQGLQIDMLSDNESSESKNALKNLEADIAKFGIESEPVKESLDKVLVSKLNEYSDLYARVKEFRGRIQDSISDSLDMQKQIQSFVTTMTAVCKVGESTVTDNALVPPMHTPSPELKLNVSITTDFDGKVKDARLDSANGQSGGGNQAAPIAAAVTSALVTGYMQTQATTSLLTQTLIASGSAAAVGLAVAAVSYYIAMEQATAEAAAISDALIYNFYHRATPADVANYYREECQTIIPLFEGMLPLLTGIEKGDSTILAQAQQTVVAGKAQFVAFQESAKKLGEIRGLVAKNVGLDPNLPFDKQTKEKLEAFRASLAASPEYKAEITKMNAVSAKDLGILLQAVMLELAMNSQKVIPMLQNIGTAAFTQLTTEKFNMLVRLVYQSYTNAFSKKYPEVLAAVAQDGKIRTQIIALRVAVDELVGRGLVAMLKMQSTSEVRSQLEQKELAFRKLATLAGNLRAQSEVLALADLVHEITRRML